MTRLNAIKEVEKWCKSSLSTATEEEAYILYEVYSDKLEAIDNLCEGYTDFEDVPNLDSFISDVQ